MLKNFSKFYSRNSLLVLIVGLLTSPLAFGQTDIYNSTTPGTGTWTRPANVTHVSVAAWGGGGAGGGAANTNGVTGGGGGGGGYARIDNRIAPATILYTFGAAGTAGSNANGGNGGNSTSTFGLNSITAIGGGGGLRSTNGLGGAGGILNIGDITSTGGAGYQGVDGTRSGAGGGSGGGAGSPTGNGGAGLVAGTGGTAGAAGLYNGGAAGANSVSANGTQGNNGSIPGSGGSGGRGASGAGGAVAGGAGGSGQILFRYISVSGITPTPVCIGTTITITGTNFATTGTTTVTINGTACTSVTVVNSTTITAVVASGTTSGTVIVTNTNGINNGQTLSVNPSSVPSITTQPIATNICTTGSGTFSVVATGATSYQWVRNGVNLTNTAPYGGVTTAILTITNPALADAGNFNVVISNAAACTVTSNTIALTVNAPPTITTNPSNSSIITGANTSFTVVATNSPTSYIWEVSTNGGSTWSTVTNGGVYSNATTATLNITAAPATMDTYRYRVTSTNSCGSVLSTVAILTVSLSYCTSSGDTTNALGIKRVSFNTIDNTPAGTAVNVSYTNYTAISTTVTKGTSYNLRAYVDTLGDYTTYQSAYIDWNRDGDFLDADEYYDLGHVRNTSFGQSGNCPYPIAIPLNAATGSIRMRIQCKYNSKTTGSCETGFIGEVEDYTLNVIPNASACAAPTAQPTALVLASANGASISGSFNAASPAADHYLVVRSTSSTPPTLTQSTFYAIGSNIGAGYTVVDNDDNTSFLATGLTANTLYYIYVYSYNGNCTGGPLYNTTSPLTGNITTANNAYCTPTSLINTNYISGITSVGTLNDVANTPTGYSSNGYANYTAITIARQIPAGGINININLVGSLGQFIYAYVDWNNNGSFADAAETVYTTGTTATGDTSFGFVVPGAQAAGNYRMRIRTRSFGDDSTINSCTQGYTTGETEDYTIAVQADCTQKITSITNGSACGPTNTVNLTAISAGATGFRWYSSETGATLIQQVVGSGNWTTPSISTTTIYYVTAYNGTCESLYRTPITATIRPTTNVTLTSSLPTVCGEGTVISVTAGGDTVTEDVLLQDFESGLGTWAITTPTNTNAGADTPWSVKTSTYQPTTTTVWKPAVNSGAVATTGNRFAFTTSDYSNSNIVTIMTSPVINAGVYNALTLTFDHYYSYYGGDKGEVQISNDNFTTINTVRTFNSDIGSASKFTAETINLSAYAGLTNLRIRFVYTANWDDGWALDNFKLTGVKPLNTTFTWSGGSVNAYIDNPPTIPYVAQSVSTIYLLPTSTQLEQASWSLTATATLGNGCPVSKVISITNDTKTWKGTINNDWNIAGNWAPNVVPDANTCVIIPTGTSSQIMNNPNALAKNLTIKGTGNLELQSGRNLTVTDWINVGGSATFNVRNSANLVQVTALPSPANSGNINMQRIAPSVDILDYVYWSTPVTPFHASNISSTSNNTKIYKWIPTTGGVNGYGNWTSGNENMTTGLGYIERGLNTSTVPVNFTSTFTGVPNNGNISVGISRGNYAGAPYSTFPTSSSSTQATQDDDNWNLLGNPYPSSIDAKAFLTANAANLDGFVKIWTHGIPPSTSTTDPFYNNYGYNYSPADYLTYNLTGSQTQNGFDGYIGAGQGFITKMLHTSATPANAAFNNSMRNATFRNDQFYRNTNQNFNNLSEGRIWLDLVSSNETKSTLIGYVNGATNGKDQMYDAQSDLKQNFRIGSLVNYDRTLIQGKGLPFDQNDQVQLAVSVAQIGNYTIAIQGVDGIFSNINQNIYLEDKLLNVIHDLRSAPYHFNMTAVGETIDRFILRYTNQTLSNDSFDFNNTVSVYANEHIKIKSTLENIKDVKVFDILGKTLLSKSKVGKTEVTFYEIKPTSGVAIVKVILDNGNEVIKKVIF